MTPGEMLRLALAAIAGDAAAAAVLLELEATLPPPPPPRVSRVPVSVVVWDRERPMATNAGFVLKSAGLSRLVPRTVYTALKRGRRGIS